MVCPLVEKKSGITEHAHVLNAAEDALLIDLRQPALPLPLAHDRGKDIALLEIRLPLLRGQGHVEDLIGPLGELLENFLASAPKQDRGQLVANPVQSAVSEQMAFVVFHAVFVQEAEGRPQSAAIDKLDNGEEFLQLVFERRAREY